MPPVIQTVTPVVQTVPPGASAAPRPGLARPATQPGSESESRRLAGSELWVLLAAAASWTV